MKIKIRIPATLLAFLLVVMPTVAAAYSDTASYDGVFTQELNFAEESQFFSEQLTFSPDKTLTKAEFFKVLLLNSGFVPGDSIALPSVSSEIAPFFQRMKELGVIYFNSETPDLRESETIALWNGLSLLMKFEGIPVPKIFDTNKYAEVFPDQSPTAFYAPVMFRAYQLGLIDPSKQNVHPFRAMTRLDFIVMLYRSEAYDARINQILDANRTSTDVQVVVNKPSELNHPLVKNSKFPILLDVWNKVTKGFLNESSLDENNLVYGAIEGLVNKLADPYSVFQEPEIAKAFQDSLSNEVQGIGASLSVDADNNIFVVSPLNNSPAAKAGLQSGDIINSVDGTTVKNLTLSQVVQLIQGPAGTVVKLNVTRRGGTTATLTIVREKVVIPSIEAKVTNEDVLIVTINNFGLGTASSFSSYLKQINTKELAGVVIDVRNNPGGFLSAAVDIAGYFIDKGQVVARLTGPATREIDYSNGPATLKGLPTYVLINGGSASASEILAGALQDTGIAKLVGTKSFGKGTVQEISTYNDTSSLKLTIAKWLTPSSRDINGTGLTPNITVQISPEDRAAGNDPQLNRALNEIRR